MSDDDLSCVTQRLGGEDQVTQRLDQPSDVTRRIPVDAEDVGAGSLVPEHLKRITERFRDDTPLMAVLRLQTGVQVADRYRVEEGPIGGISGEAEIYRCLDERTGTPVALKLYRHNMAPKEQVLKALVGLSHPDIVSVKGYGVWTGRFYEVMEYCAGGSMADHMPFSETQLREHIGQLVNGLHYCHQEGIVHRDIKPNNLFFRDTAGRESVIGDFGISSILDADDAGIRVTLTAANLTLDYAAPELLDGHTIGPPTDFYSLGITLIHLLLGRSPFKALSNTDILVTHLRGRVSLPEGLSGEFTSLLRGLLQVDPSNRWGYRHVVAWLKGQPILNGDGSPWREQTRRVSGVAYPGFPDASTPQALAAVLDRFDAQKQLFRGDIRRWVFDHFSSSLAEEIEAIEENFTHDPELGVMKLRFLLNPALPLKVANHELHSLGELVALLEQADGNVELVLHKMLSGGVLAAWVDTLSNVPRKHELVSQLDALSQRFAYKEKSLGLFALLYTLDPSRPFVLGEEGRLKSPADIESVIQDNVALRDTLADVLINGRFQEWIRAARFANWEEDLKFLKNSRVIYGDDPRLVTQAIRWYYNTRVPFTFDGKTVNDPKQLAALIDRDEASFKKGIDLLATNWIRAWLVSTGRVRDVDALDQVLWDNRASWATRMEAVLQLMDPDLAQPVLTVTVSRLSFGPISPEKPRSKTFVIRNGSRGHLCGELKLKDNDKGFSLDETVIEGAATSVCLSANAFSLPPGTRQESVLQIRSNGGERDIPIAFTIPRDKETGVDTRWLIIIGIVFLFLLMLVLF